MLNDYRLDVRGLSVSSDEICDGTEASLRTKIRELPQGTYENSAVLPSIGGVSGIGITIAVTVKGDEIIVDYTGSSGQVAAALNVTFNITCSYSIY